MPYTNTKVAILISTMNRPDFLIRTLSYYAKLQSPHPIYIGDSSNPENIRIIKTFIESLKNKLDIYFTNTIQLEAEHYTSKYTGKRTIGQKLRALVATDPEPNFVIQRKLDELSTLRYLSREQMKEYVMRELKQFIRQNPSSIGLLTTASASRHLRFISNEIGGLATDPIRTDHLRDLHSYMRGEEGMKELGIYPGYARAVEKSVERDLVHARAEV